MTKTYFKKATKSVARAKIAMTGPSGSGKTLSSIMLAKGLTNNGKVAVIDTENASASLYVDRFPDWEYFTLQINPPYTAQKYIQAIDIAVKEGFECLVIDSLTHVWAAEGGLLHKKEALDSRGGNSFSNWGTITKEYEELKSKLLHSPIHMIATMRSKQEYILEQNDKGKQAPKKVGLAPIMRDGMEYEFTVVFDIGMDHQFMVSKDRTDLFDGVVAKITEETGSRIREWLHKPEPTPPPPPPPEPEKPQVEALFEPESIKEIENVLMDNVVVDIDFESVSVKGKQFKQISEKEFKAMLKELKVRMEKVPPPSDIIELFKLQVKIKSFLSSMGVNL